MAIPTNLSALGNGLEAIEDFAGKVRDFDPIDAVFGHWTPVDSSNITAYRYNAAAQELQIKFHGGRVYGYAGVPQNIVDEFASADSKGHYLNSAIKHSYTAQRYG